MPKNKGFVFLRYLSGLLRELRGHTAALLGLCLGSVPQSEQFHWQEPCCKDSLRSGAKMISLGGHAVLPLASFKDNDNGKSNPSLSERRGGSL